MSCPIRPPAAPRIPYLRGRTGASRSIEQTAVEARRTPCNYPLPVKRLRAPCACGALQALVTDASGCRYRWRAAPSAVSPGGFGQQGGTLVPTMDSLYLDGEVPSGTQIKIGE